MKFSKKILVLKQVAEGYSAGNKPVCGICRMEKENDLLTVFLSLIGFAALPVGEYRLYIIGDDKTVVQKNLGKIPVSSALALESNLNIQKGVSAGLWIIKDDIPLLIAYQKSEDAALSAKDYGATVANEIIAERRLREREKEFAIEPPNEKGLYAECKNGEPEHAEETEKAEDREIPTGFIGEYPTTTAIYNDEAVATENYYENDMAIKRKLLRIKELSDDYLRRENGDGDNIVAQKESQGEKDLDFSQNETHFDCGEKAPYYLTVKDELDGIFSKFPAETALEKAFNGSRFAKVYYSDDKYYVVGLIKENGKEKYICYGVPSAYRETPPKELAGYCAFVPLSIFDLKGDGYFMMFQDAFTGKCVKKG